MVKKQKKTASNRAGTDQLNVRVSEELFRRINSIAGAAGKTLTAFVNEVLEERTRDHKADVQRMSEREKTPKRWQ